MRLARCDRSMLVNVQQRAGLASPMPLELWIGGSHHRMISCGVFILVARTFIRSLIHEQDSGKLLLQGHAAEEGRFRCGVVHQRQKFLCPVDAALLRHLSKEIDFLDADGQALLERSLHQTSGNFSELSVVEDVVVRGHLVQVAKHVHDLSSLGHVGHAHDFGEQLGEAETVHQPAVARGAEHKEFARLILGRLFDEHHESLEQEVGEALAERAVLHQTLDVVDNDHAALRAVGILEDLVHGVELCRLAVADHVLRRDHLDEWELAQHGQVGRQRRLSALDGAFDEDADEVGAVRVAHQLQQQMAIAQELVDRAAPRHNAAGGAAVDLLAGHAKGREDLRHGQLKVLHGDTKGSQLLLVGGHGL
eukprot:m.120790 g.120790  ORF g.120790 m.120790 type:complete len:364 (-) comp16183_c2_seq1:1434-2525(-)